jgi:CheY-like chemotaxis protein
MHPETNPDGYPVVDPLPGCTGQEMQLDELHKVVLVAEDNVVNQRLVTLLLEQLGLKAHIVENGLLAVEAVAMHDYPVVLMDCHMPEMDGFTATKIIREREAHTGRHIPIIAVTALAMVGDRERCLTAGMDDYISKPIDRESLKSKLTIWMDREIVCVYEDFQAHSVPAFYEHDPLNLHELEMFYGAANLQGVLQLFLEAGRKQIEELDAGIAEQNQSVAQRVAHELKGASASIGAKEMSLLCLQVEQLVGQQQWGQAMKTFDSVTHCFATIDHFVISHFQQPSRKSQ